MFHVLGGGSLGLLWAARLAEAGTDVRLILRDAQALQAWKAAGSSILFEQASKRSRIALQAQLADESGEPIDILILATKAYSAQSALHSVAQRLQQNASILMLQNGMGSQQAASRTFVQQQVLYASVTDGAWMPAPRHVIWAGQGQTQIGDPSGADCPQWLKHIDQQTINWQWHTDILAVLWQKLAVNCAINPYTALYDCDNGQVPTRAGAQFPRLIDELHSLLERQGANVTRAELGNYIDQVITRTAVNSSSMRQDIHARRRTEISYITGYACEVAHQAGLATPLLDQLHGALKTHLATLGLPPD
ncbi:2-dehydropantoate 2-reductase [Halopseudomonas pelagia]|uniref:2-dehydropantoate 2-reductase n=1 Tax=Halopseudomonas pelagia TaxID=553151 RepID=UPI001E3F746D|nr:2-dehydropantoate 2-reductase [Halopseudomonas pelagia]